MRIAGTIIKYPIKIVVLLAILNLQSMNVASQRFPKPEFESGYEQPEMQIARSRADFFEYLDVFVLFAALVVVTWFILRRRSRKGVFWTSVFSLLYFGFYREGCVCSIGAIQNVTLALFDPAYKIPLTVIAFFTLPLIFTLLFGRGFCAGVCPLGAIQDLLALRPLQLKTWLQKLLGLIPYIYIGLAVLYAATGTDFIICRYDPFVGFFRFDADFSMFVLGAIFLVVGVFVARPYCRFFCPYGLILNLLSRVSKRHLTISPAKCIQCRLCENSCPFGAIERPEALKMNETRRQTVRRFVILGSLIPVLVIIGALTGAQFHENLSKVHPKVRLAKEFLETEQQQSTNNIQEESKEMEAFKSSGKSVNQLYTEATEILDQFYTGGMILGGFIGLVIGLTLASLSIFRFRKDYEPNRGNCLSCARCLEYCPIKAVDDF